MPSPTSFTLSPPRHGSACSCQSGYCAADAVTYLTHPFPPPSRQRLLLSEWLLRCRCRHLPRSPPPHPHYFLQLFAPPCPHTYPHWSAGPHHRWLSAQRSSICSRSQTSTASALAEFPPQRRSRTRRKSPCHPRSCLHRPLSSSASPPPASQSMTPRVLVLPPAPASNSNSPLAVRLGPSTVRDFSFPRVSTLRVGPGWCAFCASCSSMSARRCTVYSVRDDVHLVLEFTQKCLCSGAS
jgi:hypothetical protein